MVIEADVSLCDNLVKRWSIEINTNQFVEPTSHTFHFLNSHFFKFAGHKLLIKSSAVTRLARFVSMPDESHSVGSTSLQGLSCPYLSLLNFDNYVMFNESVRYCAGN